jgi:hypothetical protein
VAGLNKIRIREDWVLGNQASVDIHKSIKINQKALVFGGGQPIFASLDNGFR